jgi:hypothetical protein
MASPSFDWSGYLTLADELAKSEDEAALRSAISRAYYYVYHLALDRAEKNDFTPVLGGAHVQLWRFFGGSPDPTCRRLGDLGNRLKENRHRADYEPTYRRISDEIPEMLKDARKFAADLANVPERLPNAKSQRQ